MTQPVLVVLDDDPTGTQTVKDVPVLTEWSVDSLRNEFDVRSSCFYILTNSRALVPKEAAALNRELAYNLLAAARGMPFAVASRSDSTLRGHFPLETDILNDILGPYDATFLIPFFEAGGRVTIDDVHYVREGDQQIPAAETPFARDPAFGYRSSNLKDYVEEKTNGRIKRNKVVSVSSGMDPDDLQDLLVNLSDNKYVVVNAGNRSDLDFICDCIREAASRGKRFLFRTAAEFVASWIKLPPTQLLQRNDLLSNDSPGLIVAGSYVPKTTRQLEELRRIHDIATVTLDVSKLLSDDYKVGTSSATYTINSALQSGKDVLLMTSREPVGHDDAEGSLDSGRRISDALVQIVSSLTQAPGWIIAKGGITSSDVATKALGIRRSNVAGQLLPGVPVWQTGCETIYPGIPYVVFPGNVGSDMALSDAYEKLRFSGES